MEKQSDEPADNSDLEDRGDEMDIEELKVGDIALAPEVSKQATSRVGISAFGGAGGRSIGSAVHSSHEKRVGGSSVG